MAKLGLRRALLVLAAIAIALVAIVLVLTGQWRALARMVAQHGIASRQIEIDKLAMQRAELDGVLTKDDAEVQELEAKRKQLEKENAADALRIEGASHDEVVAELSRRGF